VRQTRQRQNIDRDFLRFVIQRQLRKAAVHPEPGVVDQQVDALVGSENFLDAATRRRLPKIGGQHARFHPFLLVQP
jgi:hypothetical protein